MGSNDYSSDFRKHELRVKEAAIEQAIELMRLVVERERDGRADGDELEAFCRVFSDMCLL